MKSICKRTGSLFLVFCMIVALLPQISLSAYAESNIWDGTKDTTWYDASKTEFTITTAEQLAGLAELVIDNGYDFSGKTIKLGSDILLNDTTDWESWNSSTSGLHTWTPIGTQSKYFNGIFDGAGYKVSGIYISSNQDFRGLFGYTQSSSVVKNLGVTESYIKGGDWVCGMIGCLLGEVSNCYNKGNVSGNEYVGGVFGVNYGKVSNCYNTGKVTGNNFVCGVVGDNSSTVSNCYNTGDVTGNSYVGGVIGTNGNAISNCYNTGSVTGSSIVGGVVGDNSGTVSSCYYDSDKCSAKGIDGADVTGQAVGKSTADMQTATPFSGWDTTVWSFEAGKYPQLKMFEPPAADTTAPTVSSVSPSGTDAAASGDLVITFSEAMDASAAGTVKLNDGKNDTAISVGTWSADKTKFTAAYTGLIASTVYNVSISGFKDAAGNAMTTDSSHSFTTKSSSSGGTGIWDGTKDTTWYDASKTEFTLTTAEQLAGLAELVNGGNDFSGVTIKLGADIVLNDVSNVSSWGTSAPTNSWTAIGAKSHMFDATFDGAGHTVSGIYISNNLNFQGLFGYISKSAKVMNIGVKDSYIKGGDAHVGGLVGDSLGVISNCYNMGSVSGKDYVGGITGDSGTILNCYNTGVVNGRWYIGGITGYIGNSITKCYNTGSVSGEGPYVGGIVGVDGGSQSITGCYYNKETCSVGGIKNADVTGKAEGKTTAEMQTAATFSGWDTSMWSFEEGKYPQLKTPEPDTPASISSVSATNGTVTIVLDKVPSTAPVAADFTASTKIDEGPRNDLALSNFAWNSATKTVTFSFTPIAQKTESQSVVVSVKYNGKSNTASAFTVSAISSGINNGSGNNQGSSSSGSSSSSSSKGNSSPAKNYTTAGDVIMDGKKVSASTVNISNDGGKTVTTVTIDSGKFEETLASEGEGAVVTIPVSSQTDVVAGELNGQMIKNMEKKEATLEIKTATAAYTLPASQINIDSVSQQLGTKVELKDIKVSVKIAEPSADIVKILENIASKGNYQLVVKPVDFEINCTSGSKTVMVSKFNGYVERTVAIPDGVDPTKITTGIVVESDGTIRHIPTQVMKDNGKYYAKMNSLTNSTYTVIWNPITFSDVKSHWAKDSINNMGARMVISGVGNGTYNPNSAITRAEFAAIVVRALGLAPETKTNSFSDVQSSKWYSSYIQTASEYGIINGKSATEFAPNDKITREQAMAMIARAMKITGLESTLTESQISQLLTNYTDVASTSSYAKVGIASCLNTGVISGTSGNTLAPKNNITRAEVAVIVERLLKKSELI